MTLRLPVASVTAHILSESRHGVLRALNARVAVACKVKNDNAMFF
jgi:hypothetical protein